MPATISDILRTKPELITVTPERLLYESLELMIRYNYSQLPVLDTDQRVIGMITSDSILRALHHFDVTVREPKDDTERTRHLRVQDAMERDVQTCGPEAEVFTVHRQLRDASGVLVINEKGQLIGIITGYDTTEYLRQRVQDIVFVQDIEETLKDYIRLAFRHADGSEDTAPLEKAITGVMRIESPGGKQLHHQLENYLKRKDGENAQVDEIILADMLEQSISLRQEPNLDKLSLAQYVNLFLKYGLPKYGHIFRLDRKNIAPILESTTRTRNDLSHLRIDITARQRDELRLCREWLKHYYEEVRAHMLPPQVAQFSMPTQADTELTSSASLEVPSGNGDHISSQESASLDESAEQGPIAEQYSPDESRYAPLADWLYALAADQDRITLSFGQIERIIGGELPSSAREYRAWWSNDPSRQAQAHQWLNAGWRTDEVDFPRHLITFARIQPRERAYIEFFDALFKELRAKIGNEFALYQPTRVGYYWQTVAKVPDQSPYAGYTTFSFTRARRPRADLYIDIGSQAKNKQIFDQLYARRDEIEAAFGGQLEWERIPDKRASRIAVYYDRSIDIHGDAEALTELRSWGAEMLIRLKRTLDGPVREVLAQPDGNIAT